MLIRSLGWLPRVCALLEDPAFGLDDKGALRTERQAVLGTQTGKVHLYTEIHHHFQE